MISSQFLNTLLTGATGAIGTFFSDLTTSNLLEQKFFEWLGGANAIAAFNDFSNATDIQSFLLQFSGLKWTNVLQVIQSQLGSANLAAVGVLAGLLNGYDTSKASDLVRFLGDLPTKIGNLASQYNVNLSAFASILPDLSTLLSVVMEKLTAAAVAAPAMLAAKFGTGPLGALTSIYQGMV
jgi:hypothetical protein